MNVGLWMAPAVLAGLSAILWAATWLEHLAAPLAFDPGLGMPEAVDTEFTTPPLAQSLSVRMATSAPNSGADPPREERTQLCTSD